MSLRPARLLAALLPALLLSPRAAGLRESGVPQRIELSLAEEQHSLRPPPPQQHVPLPADSEWEPPNEAAGKMGLEGMSVPQLLLFWSVILGSYIFVLFVVIVVFYSFFVARDDEHGAEVGLGSSFLEASSPEDRNDSYIKKMRLTWFSVGFKEKDVQEEWQRQSQEGIQISHRARVLLFVAFSMAAYELLRMCQAYGRKERNPLVHLPLFLIHLALMVMTGTCHFRPSQLLYWPAVFALYLLIPASALPPLTPSCNELAVLTKQVVQNELDHRCQSYLFQSEELLCMDEAVRHVDCSPQGQTAMQMTMTWLLLQPWVLPELEHMHMVWAWVLIVFPIWVGFYWKMSGSSAYGYIDAVFRAFLLIATLLVAIVKKFALEKSRRIKFLQEMQQRASSAKIFHILEYMMPVHVIGPMLTDPGAPIADQVSRVSILFVLINDFDQFTRRMLPSELLKFLNDQFTRFDDICAAHKVTKIETVGEEYVAAVGVLPKDKEESGASGHAVLLERLFAAAAEIMRLQTEDVKFKMGIHTGPIVAGVIGTKLPRYRLFGDTINSAARMMQKGIPGHLQFGIETHGDLPEQLRQQVKLRGEVEMKGKGKVEVWTYEAPASPPQGKHHGSIRGRKLRASITSPGFMDADDDSAWTRRVDDSTFHETLQQLKYRDTKKSHRFWLTEKEGFTPELEKKWFEWFHQTAICHKIVRRFGLQTILVLIVSGLELRYLLDMKNSHPDAYNFHPLYKNQNGGNRLAVFVYCRGIVILIKCVFWYWVEVSKWLQSNGSAAQTLLLAACCVSVVLMYVSYDALVFSNTPKYRESAKFWKRYQAPGDQVFTLNFVLFLNIFMRFHAFLFYPSLVFLPTAIMVILAPNIYNVFVHVVKGSNDTHSYVESIFIVEGEIMFVIQIIIMLIVAHEDEQASRARFKVRHAVEETQKRTEGILNTLMPPLVVNALGALRPDQPMPTDKYRHATIAQSDLCGFTQLSASRRPAEVVKFMGDLFGAFDLLTDKHGVYKVETVGDAYIAGMAEKPLTARISPYSVLLFGLDMVRAVDDWAASMNVKVTCRVGIAYGECIGGIVGTDMQRYHLFGDLLTVMEVLESTSVEGRVQVSGLCKQEVERQLREEPSLERPEELSFAQREEESLKTSKGEVHEYAEVGGPTFLVNSSKPLRRNRPAAGTPGGLVCALSPKRGAGR